MGTADGHQHDVMTIAVNMLGPLSVSVGGRPVTITAGRLRTLLVALALSAGEDVSVDRLGSMVWGNGAPTHAGRTVQVYIARLRRLFGPDAIATTPSGYRLLVDPERVDAIRFERLLDAAAAADDVAAERAGLAQALALWRGTPFDGVRSGWLQGLESPRLVERYLSAVERRIELDLSRGAGGELVAELRELTARHPLREPLWGLLIMALYRSGQQAEALAAYRRLYRILADELGVEPARSIRQLHQRVLRNDPQLVDEGSPNRAAQRTPPAATVSSAAAERPTISQLPRDIADFSGRASEAAQLVRALREPRSATTVCGIDGMAGVGKTSLAVHAAQHVFSAYPDGLLFVDLYGHTAGRDPRTPAETLDHLLRVLGVPADQVPDELDMRVAMWRTITMSRRILLILDNAMSAEQVQPVLPGAVGCSVLITSQHRLTDLDLTDSLSLEPMPLGDAAALFGRASGIPADSAGVRDVLELCAGLPLAIRIAGTRLRHRPAWSPTDLAGRLRDEHRRLAELTVGDKGVAAAFMLSYQCLSAQQQRVFRALGVHPGDQVDARSVAAACPLPVVEAQDALEQLVDAHLLAQPVTGWYRLHDLLRVFARDEAARYPADRDEALRRVLNYYVATADNADRAAYPHRQRIDMPMTADSAPTFGSAGAALEWFDAEIDTLVTAAQVAYDRGMDDHAWRIPLAAWGCFSLRSRWSEWIDSHQVAIAAAERLGDKVALGQALGGLGVALAETGAFDSAITSYRRAIDLRRDTGDRRGEASNLGNLAVVYAERSQFDQAIATAEQAANISRSINDLARLAATLSNLGEMRRRIEDFDGAVSNLEEAVAIARQISNNYSESIALGYLAAVNNDMKNFEQAAELGQRALTILEHTTNDQLRIADVLVALGHAAQGLGDIDVARGRWERAVHILTALGHAQAVQVQELLDSLRPSR